MHSGADGKVKFINHNIAGPTATDSDDDDLAVVIDAEDVETGSESPTAVANLGGGVAPRLPNAATFDPKDPMVVCKYFFSNSLK